MRPSIINTGEESFLVSGCPVLEEIRCSSEVCYVCWVLLLHLQSSILHPNMNRLPDKIVVITALSVNFKCIKSCNEFKTKC